MANINPVTLEQTNEKVQQQLTSLEKKLGMIPNMMKVLAHSPAALNFYLAGSEALSKGTLSGQLREQIALVTAQASECQYCLAAHSAIGQSIGLSDETIQDARQGQATDPKTNVALEFAQKLLNTHGQLSQNDFDLLRQAGFSNGNIAEIISNVSFNLFTNLFNISTQTEIDFPKAPKLSKTIAQY